MSKLSKASQIVTNRSSCQELCDSQLLQFPAFWYPVRGWRVNRIRFRLRIFSLLLNCCKLAFFICRWFMMAVQIRLKCNQEGKKTHIVCNPPPSFAKGFQQHYSKPVKKCTYVGTVISYLIRRCRGY